MARIMEANVFLIKLGVFGMQNTFDNWNGNGEALAHYGVLGMKWGVRKDPKRAYERAMAKKNKLDMRAAKGSVRSATLGAKVAKTEAKKLKNEKKLGVWKKNVQKDQVQLDQLAKEGKDHNVYGTASFNVRKMLTQDQKKVDKYQGRVDKQNSQLTKLKQRQAKASVYDAKTALKAAKWTNNMLKVFGSLEYSEIEKRFGIAS